MIFYLAQPHPVHTWRDLAIMVAVLCAVAAGMLYYIQRDAK